jgi:hypothetical protein
MTLPLYRGESFTAKARRILGGPDTRPPPSWPFPTWKGQALRPEPANAPPMPKRRGPKVHAALSELLEEDDHGGT